MDVKQVVVKVLQEYLLIQEIPGKVEENSVIYGESGLLDSMGIVNLIVDLESYFNDLEIELDLTSEKALSLTNSPFNTVNTLTEFIEKQILCE